MTLLLEFPFLLFSHLMLLLLASGDGNGSQEECPPSFNCGYLGNISFPFMKTERRDCGLLAIHNCDHPRKPKMIRLQNKGKLFQVMYLPQFPSDNPSIFRDTDLYELLQSRSCESFKHSYTLPPGFHFVSFHNKANTTLFRCNRTLHVNTTKDMHKYTGCTDYDIYYTPLLTADDSLKACTKVQFPLKDFTDARDPFTFVSANFISEVKIEEECANCHYRQRGRCQLDSRGRFYCANGILQRKPWKHKYT